MMLFTFLQVSDVHLDSKLSASKLQLPAEKRRERGLEILDALLRALAIAREKSVDAVLIPGDLWDSESVTNRSVNRLIEAFADLGNIPVVIAPGNHDYLGSDSPYRPEVLQSRGMRTWPDNVHIFRGAEFTTWRHPALADVSFTGRAFTNNVHVQQRLLVDAPRRDSHSRIGLLLFHGSLDGYKGGDSRPGKLTAPFSADELSRLDFSYAAIGHYHQYTEIRLPNGPLLGAYSGCLAGRGVDEAGAHYALLGRIDSGRCFLERIEVDRRKVVSIVLDLTGLSTDQCLRKLDRLLDGSGARRNVDLVHVRAEGRHPVGGQPAYIAEKLQGAYYHFSLEDCSRPDYLSVPCDPRTTEGRFIQAMLDLKDKIGADGHDNSVTAEIVDDALYYGLDALRQRKINVRHVD